MNNYLEASKYGQRLCEALGIDTEKMPVRRIVIDVEVDKPVKVYLDIIGTTALIDVELPKTEIEIVTHAKDD